MPLTMALASTTCATGVNSLPSAVMDSARRVASAVRASRTGVPGFTKLDPGVCRPMISISIWLELAVP